MSAEAPHGVTVSCPRTPNTTQKSSSAPLRRKPSACLVCWSTYCIVLLPRIGLKNVSDSCGHCSVLASVQRTGHPRHWPFKKSKSPKYPWLTNHPSLPARVAIQTAYWVLWPAHRLLMISGLWCIICDLISGAGLRCSFLFWIQHLKTCMLSCQQFMICNCLRTISV